MNIKKNQQPQKMQSNNQHRQEFMTFDKFDKLHLKNFAENLFQIIEKGTVSSITEMREKTGYTISLNAEFGNGKTTFLKMFEHFIKAEKSNNYDVLFINAWEFDFYNEPVIAILSEFINWIEKESQNPTDMSNKNHTNKKEIISITKGVIGALGNITQQVIHSKTGIDTKEVLDSYKSSVKSFTNKKVISTGNNILGKFNIRKKSIQQIKTSLCKYLKYRGKKLIIIVDELDRTRPDYAIHFLEDMKHFFDIENVVFLVAVNRQQMEATAQCLYGQALNFEGYYRKFFKQEIDLPDPYKEAQNLVDVLIQKTKVRYEAGHRNYRVENTYLSCKMFGTNFKGNRNIL